MATEDEAREAADGTKVQVEAVDLGTVHLEGHPEGRLSSMMDIKNVREIINSAEGTLKIPEDQVLVEAPSVLQLPPEHNLNNEESSLNGHEQLHGNDQKEAERDGTSTHQSNRINKEEVTRGLSHGESTTEDSSILKCEKDEEPKGGDQQDLDVTVDGESVQEDTLKTDSAIEQTDDGQQDQNQEPDKENEDRQPADVEVVAKAPNGPQIPVEPHLDDSDAIPETIDKNTETYEPTAADGIVQPDHEESFPEASIAEPTEEVIKALDRQNHQAETMVADVIQEEMLKCEETDAHEAVPKSEAREPMIDVQEVLNQECAEETGSIIENIEETEQQSNMAAPKKTTPEHEAPTWVPAVNIQGQNHESLKEIEDAEAVHNEEEMQHSSFGFEDATPEDQPNLGVTMDDNKVQETLRAIEQKDDGQRDRDLELEKATEETQPACMANISDAEVVAEAPSRVQTPVDPNLENSGAVTDIVDGNTETNEPVKADSVIALDYKESFSEETSTAEPTEEVVKVDDQQSKQADAMDADVVQEEMHKSQHFDEPETDAHEVLNQEPAKEDDGPVNEKTEETMCQSNMATPEEITPEHDATREPPVNIQVRKQESSEEIEDVEAVDTEAPMQQSGVTFEEVVPEDQHSIGATMDDAAVPENTRETIGRIEDGQHLIPENATENTQLASEANIPVVDVEDEAPSGVQTPVEINLDNSDANPDTTDGNTETDEPAKADGVIHPDLKESFHEDISVAEPTEEVVKEEHQQSQRVEADVLQEEVPKSQHIDEQATDAQEMLNQESAEETDDPVNEKTEETEHKSNMAAPEETMPENDAQIREPAVNIQVQNEESLGEIEDAEAETQQSNVAFEETTPEEHVATTEPPSEIQHVHHVEPEEINGPGDAKDEEITNKSSTENAVQDNILLSEPTTDIHPVQEQEQTESKSTGIYEMEEASNQTHAAVLSDLAQEDATETSGPQLTETEKESEGTKSSEAQEITDHAPSKELSVEDNSTTDEIHNDYTQQTLEQDSIEVKDSETYNEKTISTSDDTVEVNVTAEEPTSDSQEIDNTESIEETKENTAENIAEVSDAVIVDEAVQQNVPQTEDIAETHTQELEPEETKSTEPVESEEASEQRNAALFSDSAQEHNTLESEMQQIESATEIMEPEAVPQETNACVSEEPSPGDHIIESEADCGTKEASITESSEVIDGDKDIITGAISGQSDVVYAGDSAQEINFPNSGEPVDIVFVQEPGSEETKKTELEEVKETSHEINAKDFQMPTQEDNPGTTEMHELTEMSNIKATEEQGTPCQSAASAQSEEQATEEITREPEMLEPDSLGEINDNEVNEPQSIFPKNIISTSEESVPEEIATEDNVTTESDVDHQQLQDQESAEGKDSKADTSREIASSSALSCEESISDDNVATEDNVTTEPDVDHQQLQDRESAEGKDIEADKPREIASSSALSCEESTSDDNAAKAEPSSDTQADNSQSAEVTVDTKIVKSNNALAEAAAPETEATIDTSPGHEAELEETKDNEPTVTEDITTSGDRPSEMMDMKNMETEAVSHESHVTSIKEITEDDTLTSNTPQADNEPVQEPESIEDTKCNYTKEHPGEAHGSTSDEPTPTEENTTLIEPAFNTQEQQNMTSQEIKDSEEVKTDECSDVSSFPTTEEADQESNLPRIERIPDVLEVQELGSTEEARNNEAVDSESHQEHKVSTLDKSAVESEPNADDQQVHEDKLPEMKDNEAIEVEEATEQSHVATPDNAAEERSELERDPDSYVLVAQQVELSKDNENSQILKAEETSSQINSVALEETTTKYTVASEMDPLVDINQESVEEIKGVDATEAQEDSHKIQADTVEKLASENNTATIEPTYDIQHVDDLEATKGMKNAEAMNDGEQSKTATLEEPTPTDNGAAPEEHPVESNEGMENQTDNVISAHGIEDEIQELAELKFEPGLASSVQEASESAPSNDKILENDPVAVTENVESEEDGEDKECTKEVNDDVHTIQAGQKEATDKIEDNVIHRDELETKSEKEEAPQLCSNEPYNMDTEIDDTAPLREEQIHDNASIKPREIEEIGENKEPDSTPESYAEPYIQNNVEQDLSSHHKVEDEKLSMAEQNDVDIEVMQEKVDEPACQDELNIDDVLNLEIKENAFDKIEETVSHEKIETGNTTDTKAVIINEDIIDKASGADVALSDESLKTFNDTGKDPCASSVITAPEAEDMNENMKDHNIDLPEHPAQDSDTPEKALCLEETKGEIPSSEKQLQTRTGDDQIPNEQEQKDKQDENQSPKEKNEENIQDEEIGDAQKEVEQDLPVSSFLMNLILGKENSDANGNSKSEPETTQGDTKEDDSYMLISKQEEILKSLPTENKVDGHLIYEQEKYEVKYSEETQEMVKEQSHDLKLDTERSMETDEEFNKNTHDSEMPAYQDNPQDEISSELLSEEAVGVSAKMECRDIEISSNELYDRAVDIVCQGNVEASTKDENGSIRNNLNDSTNTQASEEDTLGEGQTGLVLEPLPEYKSAEGAFEQAPLFTQSGMTDANDLSSETESIQNPVCAKQDKPTVSSDIEATSSPDTQLESEEVDKKEEEKHANTATGEISEENVERTHDNLPKSSNSEVTSDEQVTQIAESVSDTQIILAQEKEISEHSACMDEKQNLQTEVEIQAAGPNMQIDQDKQDEAADHETVIEPDKLGGSNFQEHQKTGVEQKSPKESGEGDKEFLAKKEVLTKEQDVHETVQSPQTVSIKSNENQELFDSKVQERDLNAISLSPREASEAEENSVDVTKPQFSTGEEQSPKPDAEEKTYDETIKDIEGIKNFSDEAATKTEASEAAPKANKKHKLLSGVGSKVKQQLAKVKKAIVGKPGHTKPESPKSKVIKLFSP